MLEAKLNQALLIVDIQNDFTGQKAKMLVEKLQAHEIIANINKLVEHGSSCIKTIFQWGVIFAVLH